MIEPESTALSDELLERLLTPADTEVRAAILDSQRLRTADGVAALIDAAAQLIASDPGKGRQLAAIAAEAAEAANLPTARLRATYLIARVHALNAEFETALRLIDQTRAEFEALGEPLEALRTNVGRIHVLREQGRYQEALDAGEIVLSGLASPAFADHAETCLAIQALAQENVGSVYEEMGRYAEALEAYAIAEAGYSALEMDDRLGAVSNNRGVVLLGLGRGREALSAFEEAAAIFAKADLTQPRAASLLNIGNAHLLLGAYNQALTYFEQARQIFGELDALADTPSVLLDTGDVYLAINLYPEAVSTYSEADSLLRAAGMPHDRARALWGMGAALAALGRLDDAEAALSEAAALFRAADNVPLLSSVMLEQASLQSQRRNRTAALSTCRAALALIAGRDFPIQHVYTHLRMADLLLPDLEAAETHLRAASATTDALGLPHLRYRLLQRLGHIRRVQGQDAEALSLLETAIEAIESLRGTLPFEAVRASFLHDKTAAYEDLVQLHLAATDADTPRRAFAAAERAKSRSLVDLLAGGAEPRPFEEGDPALGARRAALQADLNAIYLELLGGAPDTGHRVHPPELRVRAAELERELSLLRLREAAASERAPAPRPAATLAPNTAIGGPMVAYHIVGDELIAFVCVADEVRTVRRLCEVSALQRHLKRLGDQWDRFRAGPEFVAKHLDVLNQTARRVLHDLYLCLIAPIEAELIGIGAPGAPAQLAIVPHGPLHQVPFHALFDGERYLIDRFELSYAPSATVRALCATRQPRRDGLALVVGVADPNLPAISAEIETVGRILPAARIVRDAEATRETVSALAAGCTTLHLACHGLFRADNPLYSALQLGDGWLTAIDVLSLDLSGALVVLSACESGRSEILGGDELIGLARSFLGAGAVTLVVSLWLVQDEAAAELMADWYVRMATGRSRAAALREAQLALRERRPHPYYWAPFSLIGHP
jgi:tetratricopeptide (TPR) repeat protein